MTTKLIVIRRPTPAECKRGAEVVFERKEGRQTHIILACRCYESWEQWGAGTEALADNVNAVERWRRGGLRSFEEVQA
mgnify:CR=1 FL=1